MTRIALAAVLTLVAAVVFVAFALQGQWLRGLLLSFFPGGAGFALIPHKEQLAARLPHHRPSVSRSVSQPQEKSA